MTSNTQYKNNNHALDIFALPTAAVWHITFRFARLHLSSCKRLFSTHFLSIQFKLASFTCRFTPLFSRLMKIDEMRALVYNVFT